MAILTLVSGQYTAAVASVAEDLLANFADLSDILREVAEKVILPAFGKHFDNSGLRSHSGLLKSAVTRAGERGNVLEIRPTGLTAGVSYAALPYAEYVFEGRPAVRAKKAKALRFYDDAGKAIFTKSVKAVAPHPVIFLTQDEFDQIATGVTQRLVEKGARGLPK